jgi:alkanesulfonate monooxygenase SsuD/methylene tetrahydromethanopterin reductase-like flavin-dependent oxidoreductase (luciferase family)
MSTHGVMDASTPQLGHIGFRISASHGAGLDWSRLDATWAQAGEHDVFGAGWLSDHLSDASRERGGPAFEAFTTAAALAHRVPGKWIGIAVAANTFRHPALLAKEATMLDIVTRGRFILGLGAGWHVGEHEAFGIDLPEPKERFDRYESALRVLTAMFSDEARTSPGVTLDDPTHPLDRATNEPPPVSARGPQLWLGGQRRRGVELIARYATGWPMPGNRAGDVAYFSERRDAILRAIERAGRDAQAFTFAAQVDCGAVRQSRQRALAVAREMRHAGAGHVILGIPGASAPDALAPMADEVAEPLLESWGVAAGA